MTTPDTNTPARQSSVKDGDLATPMELRDFLEGVGTTMRLPPKTTVRMQAVAAPPVVRTQTPVFLPTLAVCVLAAFAFVELRPAPVGVLPPGLAGTWETTDPRYAGRYLVLSPGRVTQVFPGGQQADSVRAVSTVARGGTMAVVISHGGDGAVSELQLGWVQHPVEHLVLRNPEGVRWTRKAVDAPAPEPAAPNAPGGAATNPAAAASAPR